MRLTTVLTLIGAVCLAGAVLAKEETKPLNLNPALASLDCTNAIEAQCNSVLSGDNTGLPNNVSNYSCSGWTENGGEEVYHLYFNDPTTITVALSNMACDLDIWGLNACDETQCVAYGNTSFTYGPVTGDFFVVVDGYGTAECSYDLSIDCEIFVPANICDQIRDPDCDIGIAGNTCDGENNVYALGCQTYNENGLEHYYSLTLPPGEGFTAAVTNTTDGALWVIDSCFEPLGCLAYADDTFSGQEEVVTYTNTGTETIAVFLVIDSYSANSCGDYTGTLDCSPGVIPNLETSWGQLKALYNE